MAGTGNHIASLRPNRIEGERLMLALVISLFVHLLLFSGYVLSREIPMLRRALWQPPKYRLMPQVQKEEQPLEFVTVRTPSTETPQQAKYFSNKNSVAADNSQNQNTDTPQLNGRQADAPQTEDLMRSQAAKAEAAQAQKEANNTQGKAESKPAQNTGDLTLGKADNAKDQQQEQPRPRTLKEAYEQMANKMPSMTMKEDGGVERHARVPSFDVKVTGFGDYDARFVEAVSQNWYNLLDSQRFSLDRTGKVVLLFRLNDDGSVTLMRFGENHVGDLLGYVCEKAVLDGAPYEPWTEDMRLKLGTYADVQFTFDYYAQ
jgi:hypothetical protein